MQLDLAIFPFAVCAFFTSCFRNRDSACGRQNSGPEDDDILFLKACGFVTLQGKGALRVHME